MTTLKRFWVLLEEVNSFVWVQWQFMSVWNLLPLFVLFLKKVYTHFPGILMCVSRHYWTLSLCYCCTFSCILPRYALNWLVASGLLWLDLHFVFHCLVENISYITCNKIFVGIFLLIVVFYQGWITKLSGLRPLISSCYQRSFILFFPSLTILINCFILY